MSREPFTYSVDTSRLKGAPPAKNLKLIYEPLTPVVTDDWLRPYVYLLNDVAFHVWWRFGQEPTSAASEHAKYRWTSGDIIESDGELWELMSAKCVFHDPSGQWAMRWIARRAKAGAVPRTASDWDREARNA